MREERVLRMRLWFKGSVLAHVKTSLTSHASSCLFQYICVIGSLELVATTGAVQIKCESVCVCSVDGFQI